MVAFLRPLMDTQSEQSPVTPSSSESTSHQPADVCNMQMPTLRGTEVAAIFGDPQEVRLSTRVDAKSQTRKSDTTHDDRPRRIVGLLVEGFVSPK
ncbi:hypothetical protein ACG7TL_003592 [Trametes sanguinea]